MRVKSLELINVKSFEDSKLEFSESINILVGANNAGKSTVIKGLLNLQYRCFTSNDIRAKETYAKTFIEVTNVTEVDNLLFYNPSHHGEFEKGKSFLIVWAQFPLNEKEELLYVNGKHLPKRNKFDKISIKNPQNLDESLKQFTRFPDIETRNNFIYPFLAKRKTDYYEQRVSQEQTYKVMEGLRNLAAKIQKVSNSSHPKSKEFIDQCDEILGFKIGVIPTGQNQGKALNQEYMLQTIY
jgi:AAA15 family ATPase/GTPase